MMGFFVSGLIFGALAVWLIYALIRPTYRPPPVSDLDLEVEAALRLWGKSGTSPEAMRLWQEFRDQQLRKRGIDW